MFVNTSTKAGWLIAGLMAVIPMLVWAEKPAIDAGTFGGWPFVGYSPKISDDGRYALYSICSQVDENEVCRTVVLQTPGRGWKIDIPDVADSAVHFTSDSRQAVFLAPGERLGILKLGTETIKYIPQVSSFQLSPGDGEQWLAYRVGNDTRELRLRNLARGVEKTFPEVVDYWFVLSGQGLVLRTEEKKKETPTQSLRYVNLAGGEPIVFWTNSNGSEGQEKKAMDPVFDAPAAQVAFMVQDQKGDSVEKSLWYYKIGQSQAVLLADGHSPGIDGGLEPDYVRRFSRDGRELFFSLAHRQRPRELAPGAEPRANPVKVDVWSYKDAKVQAQQLEELKSAGRAYAAVVGVGGGRVIRLEQENEWISGEDHGGMVFVTRQANNAHDWNGSQSVAAAAYVVSIKDGKRKLIADADKAFLGPSLQGKYALYYDGERGDYFSYETETGVVRDITRNIRAVWTIPDDDHPGAKYSAKGPVAWLKGDKAVLLYDQNDIWEVDPSSSRPAINLTQGYGRKHNIRFSLAEGDGGYRVLDQELLPQEKLLLTAFNLATKDNGFYRMTADKAAAPELLTMGPYAYDPPIKAKHAEAYLVQRQSAKESPNYFFTTDLKHLTPLSEVHPEKGYNWLTTELITWQVPGSGAAQGVLYKPENLDPGKKYPLIFHFYERFSDQLNKYKRPEASFGRINIPYFVSRGYLVFEPDILHKIGEPGPSALHTMVSAVDELAKLPYVDVRHIGINGHSWGAFQTDYIVTHTGIFAAAMSASGSSDFISQYNSVRDGTIVQADYENTFRMGATLWERPELYISNSAIFAADKVTTPILMMNNKADTSVPFTQGVEFFLALRRLGKKVWMLQYDDSGHVAEGRDALDLTVRMQQFFDHYLKGAPPPKWMTEGIPARLKGIETGVELDTSGKLP